MNKKHIKDAVIQNTLTFVLAALCAATSLMMVMVGGWFGGEDILVAKAIWMACSVAFCIGSQILPSISGSKKARALWVVCVGTTVFNVMSCFDIVSRNAGESHLRHSPAMVGLERQIGEINKALSTISARPLSSVSQELSATSEWRKRSTLTLELSEARRAATLHDQLISLITAADKTVAIGVTDSVYSGIGQVTGLNARGIQLSVEFTFSLLLELLGAYLWLLILSEKKYQSQSSVLPTLSETFVTKVDKDLIKVSKAISSGKLKNNVIQVRLFLSCGQSKAQEICKRLKAQQVKK